MISVLNLGRIDYGTALELQQTLVSLRKDDRISDVLLLLEHTPVITLGRNASDSNIVVPREFLAGKGVELFECDRGGDVTFHGPGQLVAYPIFDLRGFQEKIGAVEYVRRLEEVLMLTCSYYGIRTQRIKGMTGVWTYAEPPTRKARGDSEGHRGPQWVPHPEHSEGWEHGFSRAESSSQEGHDFNQDSFAREGHGFSRANDAQQNRGASAPGGDQEGHDFSRANHRQENEGALAPEVRWQERKIAAIGVHISRAVTSHGFALNVTTDLDYFKLIVPCGLTKPVTSIEFETGQRPSLEELMPIVTRHFGQIFKSQILWLESLHDLLPGIDIGSPRDTPATAPTNLRELHGDDIFNA